MPTTARLVLASASPRRKDLLAGLGLPFEVQPAPGGDDAARLDAPLKEIVARLANEKAEAVAATMAAPHPVWVLGADTLGAIDGELLSKPIDSADAERILALLAGRVHEVATGLSVLRMGPAGVEARAADVAVTRVRFLAVPPAAIRAYVATGEPMDKAAAYAVQGAAAAWVDHIEGSWSNVVGLPLHLVPVLLAATGYPLPAHLALAHKPQEGAP